MLCPPKNVEPYEENVERTPKDTRPLSLKNTDNKIIALAANNAAASRLTRMRRPKAMARWADGGGAHSRAPRAMSRSSWPARSAFQ